MTERKSNRRDEKLEASGISRKEWVAKAIALAGMHGTGGRRPQGKAKTPKDEAPEADESDEAAASDDEQDDRA